MAKKPFNVLSATALAAVLASSAIVPTAVFAAETTQSVQNVIVEHEGEIFELSYEDYTNAKSAGVNFGEVKYVVSSNGKQYKYSDFTQAKPVGSTVDGTLELLEKDPTNVQDVTPGKVIIGEDGKPEYVPPVVNGDFEVTDIAAINETSVTVTFPNDAGIEESDLTGKEITLKAGETTLTATYKADSLTKEGKATFSLSGDSKLVDATTYTASAENLTFTNAEFVAKVSPAYVASFEKVTTALTATPKGANDAAPNGETNPATVTFAAMDQYGEEIALSKMETPKVEVTLNGVLPLEETKEAGVKDFAFNKTTGLLTITKTIKESDELTIKLSNTKTVDGKEVVLGSEKFEYTVQKAEATKVTSISLNAGKVSLPAKEGTALNVKVLDQFKNEITDTEDNAVTFVVNGKVVTPGADAVIQTTGAGKYTFKATKPGEYNVVVVSANDSKVTASTKITVGAATLTDLIVDKTIIEDVVTEVNERFNKEDIVVATVKPSEGAALAPENLKFNVTTTSTGVTKEDVTVTAETKTVGTGTDAKEVIVIKANAAKSGTFTVTPYVGESFTADKVIKGESITFTTDKNPKVDSISAVSFDAKELKVGAEIKKDIVFKNVNGETVLPTSDSAAGVTVTSSNKEVATGKVVVVEDEETKAKTTELQIKGLKAGTTVITVQAGDQVSTYTLKIVGAELTKVDAGSTVTGVVAGDRTSGTAHNDKAKYNELKFTDQDGQEVKLTDDATVELSATGVDKDGKKIETVTVAELATLGVFTSKKGEEPASFVAKNLEKSDEATHVQVLPAADVAEGTYTVTVKAKQGKKEVTNTFTIEVGAARVAATLDVTAKSTSVTTGGTTELTVVPKDQYGNFILVDTATTAPHFNVEGDEFVTGTGAQGAFEVTGVDKDGKTDGDIVAYKVKVEGTMIGTGNVKVQVLGEKVDGKAPVLATASQSIKVGSVGQLVDKVEIVQEDVQDTSTEAAVVDLKAVGKDAAGNDVTLNEKDLTWSVKSVKGPKGETLTIVGTDFTEGVTLKNADGKFLVADGEFADSNDGAAPTGAVTLKLDGNTLTGVQGLTVDVEVQAKTANNKFATSTVKFNAEGAKFVKDLAIFNAVFNKGTVAGTSVAAKDLTDNGLKISFNDDQVATDGIIGDIELTFTGVDQYGNPIVDDQAEPTIGKVELDSLTTDNRAAVSVDPETLTLTAEGEGTATIYATKGGETIEISVTVPKSVIDKKISVDNANVAAQVDGLIVALPKAAEVTPANTAALKEAYEGYNALTSAQKALVDPANKTKLDAVIKAAGEKVVTGTTLNVVVDKYPQSESATHWISETVKVPFTTFSFKNNKDVIKNFTVAAYIGDTLLATNTLHDNPATPQENGVDSPFNFNQKDVERQVPGSDWLRGAMNRTGDAKDFATANVPIDTATSASITKAVVKFNYLGQPIEVVLLPGASD